MNIKTLIRRILAGTTLALLGCGGGGGGGTAGPAGPPAGSTTISGVAMLGPINGADVTVYAVKSDGTVNRSGNLGSGKTGADGSFSVTLTTAPTGPVVVEVTPATGATFTDEVNTAAPVPFKATLRSVVKAVAAGAISTVAVTPITEMASKRMDVAAGGFTAANIDAANLKVATFFGVGDIINSLPVDPTKAAPATATADQKKYAAALGIISQLVENRKGAKKTEDALVDELGNLDTELKDTGEFSGDTIAAIINAATAFVSGNKNLTGITASPVVKPTAGTLRLSTTGTLPAGALVGGIDVTMTLPAGASVKTLAGSPLEPDTGVVAVSGEAAKAGGTTITAAKFTPASGATPATIKFIIGNSSATAATASGFALGEFVTIKCDLAATAAFPVNADFKVQAISVMDGTNAANSLNSTVKGATAFNAVF
jgi:hypothetical protein